MAVIFWRITVMNQTSGQLKYILCDTKMEICAIELESIIESQPVRGNQSADKRLDASHKMLMVILP